MHFHHVDGEAKVAATSASCHQKWAKPRKQPSVRVGEGQVTQCGDGAAAVVVCPSAGGPCSASRVGKAGVRSMERQRQPDDGGVGHAGRRSLWSDRET
jgi:hypothetical protein